MKLSLSAFVALFPCFGTAFAALAVTNGDFESTVVPEFGSSTSVSGWYESVFLSGEQVLFSPTEIGWANTTKHLLLAGDSQWIMQSIGTTEAGTTGVTVTVDLYASFGGDYAPLIVELFVRNGTTLQSGFMAPITYATATTGMTSLGTFDFSGTWYDTAGGLDFSRLGESRFLDLSGASLAPGTELVLAIRAPGSDGLESGVDNISVTAVPESSTLTCLLPAMLLLRRRRA